MSFQIFEAHFKIYVYWIISKYIRTRKSFNLVKSYFKEESDENQREIKTIHDTNIKFIF